MSCNSAKYTRLLARLRQKEASLELAYEMYDKLVAEDILEYRFESGEGAQRVERRKLLNIMQNIQVLEAEIDHLYGRLCGTGIVKMNMRRKSYNYGGRGLGL